jgi:protein phosphatase 2C family protein 2/3
MLVVALLGGKIKERREWVADCIKNQFGHATPEVLPQLYSQSRLMAFKAKRAAEEAREKGRMNRLGGANATPGFGFAQIFGSTGGISSSWWNYCGGLRSSDVCRRHRIWRQR